MASWPTTADAVVRRAMRDIGLTESPSGSNHNKITSAYGIGDGPWCAMAIWYWFHAEGVNLKTALPGGQGWAYTVYGVSAAKRAGLWHQGASGVKRGDVAFYKLPGAEGNDFVNHVGLIASASSGSVTSIEGNTANIVAQRIRPRPYIVGYMRPPYGGTGSPKPAPPKIPPFPGRGAFKLGHSSAAVTMLDKQLIRTGYAKSNDGNGYQAGPVFTKYTQKNVKAFQLSQGWKGRDADGYPGPETWSRLFKAATKKAG